MSRKRILMVIPQLGYGGAEGAFIRLARYLSQEADVSIALMARDYGGGNYSSAHEELDLPIVMLDGERHAGSSLLSKAARWWRMLRKMRRIKHDCDVAISFMSGANLLNALAGPAHKTIVSERGSKLHHVGISRWKKILWLRLLDPLTYRRSGSIVAVSKGYATEVMKIAGGAASHKVVAIEGLIEVDNLLASALEPVDADIEIFCQNPVIVFCGRLDIGKGIDRLIPAFAAVRKRFPEVRLLLIGDGPLGTSMKEDCEINSLGITMTGDPNAAVFFAGYRSNPARFYRISSLFVLPSFHEGLPNALIEALASGIPIMAADCPWGPRSIISGPDDKDDDGPAGLPRELRYGTLMPVPNTPENVAVWSDAIFRVLVDEKIHMSRSDAAAAIARFDISVTGKEWLRIVSELSSRTEKLASNKKEYR